MACILHIETSTEVCSVSIGNNGQIIFKKEKIDGPSHASVLGVFVDEAVKYVRQNNLLLNAIAVSSGPGSYTGLRIGVSEAKGLCYGFDIPLIAIEPLKIMAAGFLVRFEEKPQGLLCPMIDARRMEVYDAIYTNGLEERKPVSADIIDADSFSQLLVDNKIYFFGNGAQKCKDVLQHPNANFVDGVYPCASDMLALAEEAFDNKEFVDVAYFEPFYLKEFVATTPKNKVLPLN